MGSPAQQGWPGLRPRGHPRWCDGGQGSTLGSGLSPGLSLGALAPSAVCAGGGPGSVAHTLLPPLPSPSASPPLFLSPPLRAPPASKAPASRSPALSPEGSDWSVRGGLGAWKVLGDIPAMMRGRQVARCGQPSGPSGWPRQSASLPPWGGRCVGPMAPACLLGPLCPAASVRQAGHSPGHCPGADGAAHGPARQCRWPPRGPWWTCWPESGRAPPARRTGRGPRGARWSGSRRLWDRAPCAPSARPRRPPPSHSTPAPARGRQVRGRLHAARPGPWYEGLRSAPRPFPY